MSQLEHGLGDARRFGAVLKQVWRYRQISVVRETPAHVANVVVQSEYFVDHDNAGMRSTASRHRERGGERRAVRALDVNGVNPGDRHDYWSSNAVRMAATTDATSSTPAPSRTRRIKVLATITPSE